jgi:2'-5' RNA ligase
MASYIKVVPADMSIVNIANYQTQLKEFAGGEVVIWSEPTTFHTTLMFLERKPLELDRARAVQNAIPTWEAVDVLVQGPTIFPNLIGDDWVIKLDIIDRNLEAYRQSLIHNLRAIELTWDNTFDFHPHVTLGFVKQHNKKWLSVKPTILLLSFSAIINFTDIVLVNQ